MSKANCIACHRRENVNHLGLCDQCAQAEEMAAVDMMADRENARMRVDGFKSRRDENDSKDADRRAR